MSPVEPEIFREGSLEGRPCGREVVLLNPRDPDAVLEHLDRGEHSRDSSLGPSPYGVPRGCQLGHRAVVSLEVKQRLRTVDTEPNVLRMLAQGSREQALRAGETPGSVCGPGGTQFVSGPTRRQLREFQVHIEKRVSHPRDTHEGVDQLDLARRECDRSEEHTSELQSLTDISYA